MPPRPTREGVKAAAMFGASLDEIESAVAPRINILSIPKNAIQLT